MGNIVWGSRVKVEVAKGDFRKGIFSNYSGKGDGAWIDFPDSQELSDFYPMSAITELFDELDEEPVMLRTNCPGCGDEIQVAMVDGAVPRKMACHDCTLEITDNQQTTHELAKAILTVLNSAEDTIDRLIKIRTICYKAIDAYEAINRVEDNEPETDDAENKIIPMDPHQIIIHVQPTERDIKYQMARLEREGQIEPIALKADNSPDLAEWLYADAEIIAAIRLGWPTLLFTYDYKDND